MRSKITATVLSFLALALLICLRAAQAESDDPGHDPSAVGNHYVSTAEPEQSSDDGGEGFAKKVAGTYVDDGEFPDIGVTFVGTVTINSDGTMRATNSNCCGADVNPDGEANLQSPGQGNWKKTGQRQITITAITFVQPFAGLPAGYDCPLGCTVEDGVLAARPKLVVDFAPDYKTATATFMTDIFLLRQDFDEDGILDYLDPDGAPLVTFPGTDSWTRIPVID